jgi:sulfotransferase
MFKIVRNLRRVSNHITRCLGIMCGDYFPFYYVAEHPRSCGTWIAHMVSDYLQLPFPKISIFPLGFKCIIHNHWPYHSRYRRAIYVVRDGRDVAISSFFYALRHIKLNKDKEYFLAIYPSLRTCELEYSPAVFERFLSEWFIRPAGCRYNWIDHIKQWAFENKNVCVVKYEDFHADCETQLRILIEWLCDDLINSELIAYTVNKFSFRKQTRRNQGECNEMSRKRKGIIGDWKNYFTPESLNLFEQKAGNIMKQLGYSL